MRFGLFTRDHGASDLLGSTRIGSGWSEANRCRDQSAPFREVVSIGQPSEVVFGHPFFKGQNLLLGDAECRCKLT